jgi:hypothetical protein
MTKFLFIIIFNIITIKIYSQNQLEIGKAFISSLFLNKDFEKSYSFFDEVFTKEVSISSLDDVTKQIESQLGKFNNIIEINNTDNVYYFYSKFDNQNLDIVLNFNKNKKIIGFFFVPHKEIKLENSLGKEHDIISNDIKLKGTLLVPENDNLKKLVVFVHGSGPNDRDETVFENKPFKDIAENLYEQGISSYRFDKKTYSNPESFNDKSTIDDEVTTDIVNIINYFKQDTEFSQYEIIVLGHSLGANLLPRIANKTNIISKIILLAGNARPLDMLIMEQYEYLYQLSPTQELKDDLQKIKEQIAVLNSKNFSLTTPKEKLPFNLSAYYWKSVLEYNPIKEIQKVKIPILILQGERDYQVTMKDFAIWENSLKNNPKTTFISYPKLNHLFMSGEGIVEPKEYAVKGNVDDKVINDIKIFIENK